MNILILGGNGFLGSHLSNALVLSGHTVKVFDRYESKPCIEIKSGVEYLFGNFSQTDLIEQALTGCDAVFHLISTTLPKTSNEKPIYDLESNLLDTVKFLEIATKQGIQKVIFASSGGTVYGIPLVTPIDENHPTDPICSYGISKLAIEKYLYLFEYLHNLSFCILRLANPYGEGQLPTRLQGAISVFADKALKEETIPIWGDGSVVRDYIYIDDVIDAFIKALLYNGTKRVFNIGSGTGHSINKILETIELICNSKVKREYLNSRSFDVPINILDINNAKNELLWKPRIPLLNGLTRTIAWLQKK